MSKIIITCTKAGETLNAEQIVAPVEISRLEVTPHSNLLPSKELIDSLTSAIEAITEQNCIVGGEAFSTSVEVIQ